MSATFTSVYDDSGWTWNQQQTMRMAELLVEHVALSDRKHKQYFSQAAREAAYRSLATQLSVPPAVAQQRVSKLRNKYYAVVRRIRAEPSERDSLLDEDGGWARLVEGRMKLTEMNYNTAARAGDKEKPDSSKNEPNTIQNTESNTSKDTSNTAKETSISTSQKTTNSTTNNYATFAESNAAIVSTGGNKVTDTVAMNIISLLDDTTNDKVDKRNDVADENKEVADKNKDVADKSKEADRSKEKADKKDDKEKSKGKGGKKVVARYKEKATYMDAKSIKRVEKFKLSLCKIMRQARATNGPKLFKDMPWPSHQVHAIWNRIRGVCKQKLEALIRAGDVEETFNTHGVADGKGGPAERITPAEWQLIDLMLLYEEYMEMITHESLQLYEQLRPLVSLFHLTQRTRLHDVTSGDGSDVSGSDTIAARAWLHAHQIYTSQGKTMSLLGLQKRWHELKQRVARSFLSYWQATHKQGREPSSVTEPEEKLRPPYLYQAIARRYPAVVTSDIPEWSDLVQQGKVFLSVAHCQRIIGGRASPTQLNDVTEPGYVEKPWAGTTQSAGGLHDDDLIVVENDVEVIDLDADPTSVSGNKTTPVKEAEILANIDPDQATTKVIFDSDEDWSNELTNDNDNAKDVNKVNDIDKEISDLTLAIHKEIIQYESSNKVAEKPNIEVKQEKDPNESEIARRKRELERDLKIFLGEDSEEYDAEGERREGVVKEEEREDVEVEEHGVDDASRSTTEVETEITENMSTSDNDEVPPIDKKLIMIPIVSLIRIDHTQAWMRHAKRGVISSNHIRYDGLPNKRKKIDKDNMNNTDDSSSRNNMDVEDTSSQGVGNIVKDLIVPEVKEEIRKQIQINLGKEIEKLREKVIREEMGEKEEEEEEVKITVMNVSTHPLERPRMIQIKSTKRRNYTPELLCRNPDFNSRLKRLGVTFLLAHRNRVLMDQCPAVTVDVERMVESSKYLRVYSSTESAPGRITKRVQLPDLADVRRINKGLLTAQVTPNNVEPTRPTHPTHPTDDGDDTDDQEESVSPPPASRHEEFVTLKRQSLQKGVNANNCVMSKETRVRVQPRLRFAADGTSAIVHESKYVFADIAAPVVAPAQQKKEKRRAKYALPLGRVSHGWWSPAANAPAQSGLTRDTLDKILQQLATGTDSATRRTYCCLARRHRSVNDARRRLSARLKRRYPEDTLIHIHTDGICKCCCAALLTDRRAKLNKELSSVARCVHALLSKGEDPEQLPPATPESEHDSDEGEGNLVIDETERAVSPAPGPVPAAALNDKEKKIRANNLRRLRKSVLRGTDPRRKKKKTDGAAGGDGQKHDDDDDGYQEWIRQRNIVNQLFSFPSTPAPYPTVPRPRPCAPPGGKPKFQLKQRGAPGVGTPPPNVGGAGNINTVTTAEKEPDRINPASSLTESNVALHDANTDADVTEISDDDAPGPLISAVTSLACDEQLPSEDSLARAESSLPIVRLEERRMDVGIPRLQPMSSATPPHNSTQYTQNPLSSGRHIEGDHSTRLPAAPNMTYVPGAPTPTSAPKITLVRGVRVNTPPADAPKLQKITLVRGAPVKTSFAGSPMTTSAPMIAPVLAAPTAKPAPMLSSLLDMRTVMSSPIMTTSDGRLTLTIPIPAGTVLAPAPAPDTNAAVPSSSMLLVKDPAGRMTLQDATLPPPAPAPSADPVIFRLSCSEGCEQVTAHSWLRSRCGGFQYCAAEEYIQDRNPRTLKLLQVSHDGMAALWKLTKDLTVVTETELPCEAPQLWTLAPNKKILQGLAQDAEALSPLAIAPQRVNIDNKLYLKLTNKPLIYAQVLSLVPDAACLRRLLLASAPLLLYNRQSGELTPLHAALTQSRPKRIALHCDSNKQALKQLVRGLNEFVRNQAEGKQEFRAVHSNDLKTLDNTPIVLDSDDDIARDTDTTTNEIVDIDSEEESLLVVRQRQRNQTGTKDKVAEVEAQSDGETEKADEEMDAETIRSKARELLKKLTVRKKRGPSCRSLLKSNVVVKPVKMITHGDTMPAFKPIVLRNFTKANVDTKTVAPIEPVTVRNLIQDGDKQDGGSSKELMRLLRGGDVDGDDHDVGDGGGGEEFDDVPVPEDRDSNEDDAILGL